MKRVCTAARLIALCRVAPYSLPLIEASDIVSHLVCAVEEFSDIKAVQLKHASILKPTTSLSVHAWSLNGKAVVTGQVRGGLVHIHTKLCSTDSRICTYN